jgi:hypothetical protein
MATTATPPPEVEFRGAGTKLMFSNINEPGTYFSNSTGHMIRVPEDELLPGRSPAIEIRGKEPIFVTKLSDDPFIPLSKARLIACDLDLQVNF